MNMYETMTPHPTPLDAFSRDTVSAFVSPRWPSPRAEIVFSLPRACLLWDGPVVPRTCLLIIIIIVVLLRVTLFLFVILLAVLMSGVLLIVILLLLVLLLSCFFSPGPATRQGSWNPV